ncbi:MAG TPA: MFS transporter [Caulobacteraceae bacterium]|jgi:MFS family permease|nr:MFS transporter [Caulobacteraceae bacterium]
MPDDAAPYPRPAYAWSVVAILFLTAVLSYTDRQVLSLLVDPIRAELKIDDTQMSLLLGAAFAVIYGIAGVPLGWFADRTSRRNLILGGVLVWGIGTLACGFAQSFGELFAARIVVGLGEAVLSPAAISLISDYLPERRRGFALGVYFSGIAVGVGSPLFIGSTILGAIDHGLFLGTPLAHLSPWRLVLLVLGTPSLLWALLILAIREPARRGSEAAQAVVPPTGGVDWTPLLLIAPVYLAVAIASLVDNGVGAWVPSLLIRTFKAAPTGEGMKGLGLLITAGYGGGMLLGGFLADRMAVWRGPRGKIELCLAAAASTLLAALLIRTPALDAVMISTTLYFALSAVVTASGLSAILDATPNRSRGLAMAISFFLNVAVGAGIGPTVVALAGDKLFGKRVGLGAPIAFTIAVFFSIAAIALVAALVVARRHRATVNPVGASA